MQETRADKGSAGQPRAPRRPTWLKVVSGGVVTVLVAVAAIFAVRAEGEPVHDVALTDGGIWVSGGRTGFWGRVNTGAHALDLIVDGAGRPPDEKGVLRPDILQDGRNAVGVTSDRRLIAIDTRTGDPLEGSVQVPEPTYGTGFDFHEPDLVAMGGNTIAVVDHDSGRIWAKRLDPKGGTPIADLRDTGELATVGPAAAVTVDLEGDVMAVSAETGTVVEIPAEGAGFGSVVRTDAGFSGRAADITAVGDAWVVLDLEKGEIHAEDLTTPQPLPEGTQQTAGVSLAMAALQQAGPASDLVAVQTTGRAGYVRITEDSQHAGGDSGVVSGLEEDDEQPTFQRISRPVRNGDCLNAAWGEGNAIRFGVACGQAEVPTTQLLFQSDIARQNGVAVRYNRGQVLLNDLDTGRLFDLSLPSDPRIDTWPGGASRAEPTRYVPDFLKSRTASTTPAPRKTSAPSTSTKSTTKPG